MARVLITGSQGFVGRYLVERMVDAGHEVWGIDRSPAEDFPGHRHIVADATQFQPLDDAIVEAQPEHIMHLAAQSSVRESFDQPYETLLANTLPILHLLNILQKRVGAARLLAVGSADEYGPVPDPKALPLREDSSLNPVNPYAIAKSVQGRYCRGYAELYGVKVVMTRSFNHTGPGQSDKFVLPTFARQVASIKLGLTEPVIKVGNLDVRRDFLDVRDVCAAYTALIEHGVAGETYNVCSGTAHTLRDLLTKMCDAVDIDVEIQVDPDRLRPAETPELRGNNAKLKAATGWEPKISIEQTMSELVEYWTHRLRLNGTKVQ